LIEGTGTEPDEEILKNDRSKVFTRCWVAVAQDRRYREESCDVMEEKDQGGGDGTEESDKWAAFQRGMPMAAFAPPVQIEENKIPSSRGVYLVDRRLFAPPSDKRHTHWGRVRGLKGETRSRLHSYSSTKKGAGGFVRPGVSFFISKLFTLCPVWRNVSTKQRRHCLMVITGGS
jgi:hypothetical protein